MNRRWILVTGTSRGIGRATALRLARSGASVLAGVRRAEDGASLENESRGRIASLRLDINDDDSIAAASERIAALVEGDGLFGLVNNAASAGHQGPMEFVERAQLEAAFATNAFGTMLITRALLPLIRRARGRIVNVGAGRIALSPMGPGFGSKLAMEAMTDVLRAEVRSLGVRISIVEPGMTRWEDVDAQLAAYGSELDESLRTVTGPDRKRFEAVIDRTKVLHRRMMVTAAPADRVAGTIERALNARWPRARYHCGWEQKTAAWLERLAPQGVRDAIVRRTVGL